MNDMLATIAPKSDQLNADDLVGGPITVTITRVDVKAGQDQPVHIHHDFDQRRPWKPCKSMRRVLVAAWGANSAAYIGRSVTLYRDPTASYGGQAVGGIRVSHMSHIKAPLVLPVTIARGKRAVTTIQPLTVNDAPPPSKQRGLTLWTPAEEVQCDTASEWLTTLQGWLSSGIDGAADVMARNADLLSQIERAATTRQDEVILSMVKAIKETEIE